MGILKEWSRPAHKQVTIRRKTEKYPEKLARIPHSVEEQNVLADELIEWAQQEDSLFLEKFPLSKFLSPYLFFKLAKSNKNDYFTRAVDFARACCSIRQLEGNHSIDSAIIQKLLPVYNRQYQEYLTEREDRMHTYQKELKTIDIQKNDAQNVITVIEKITSDIVPVCNDTTNNNLFSRN